MLLQRYGSFLLHFFLICFSFIRAEAASILVPIAAKTVAPTSATVSCPILMIGTGVVVWERADGYFTHQSNKTYCKVLCHQGLEFRKVESDGNWACVSLATLAPVTTFTKLTANLTTCPVLTLAAGEVVWKRADGYYARESSQKYCSVACQKGCVLKKVEKGDSWTCVATDEPCHTLFVPAGQSVVNRSGQYFSPGDDTAYCKVGCIGDSKPVDSEDGNTVKCVENGSTCSAISLPIGGAVRMTGGKYSALGSRKTYCKVICHSGSALAKVPSSQQLWICAKGAKPCPALHAKPGERILENEGDFFSPNSTSKYCRALCRGRSKLQIVPGKLNTLVCAPEGKTCDTLLLRDGEKYWRRGSKFADSDGREFCRVRCAGQLHPVRSTGSAFICSNSTACRTLVLGPSTSATKIGEGQYKDKKGETFCRVVCQRSNMVQVESAGQSPQVKCVPRKVKCGQIALQLGEPLWRRRSGIFTDEKGHKYCKFRCPQGAQVVLAKNSGMVQCVVKNA